MTLVICPNLALDRVIRADAVRPRGMTRGHALRTQAGGKGANAVRALRALATGAPAGGSRGGAAAGVAPAGEAPGGGPAASPALLTGFAAGRTGLLVADLARDEGIDLQRVPPAGEARVSTVVLGDDGSVTRLYEFGPEVGAVEESALIEVVRQRPATCGEWAIVDGQAPPGVTPGFYGALTAAAREVGYLTLVDAAGEQLAGALAERPDLVKVNLEEARSAVGPAGSGCDGEPVEQPARLVALGLELCDRLVAGGAGGAIVTLGATGAAALLDGREWEVRAPSVKAVNPVGSGDCFAGALVASLERGAAPAEALALAAGAGAANAVSPFTGHVDAALARELAGRACVGPPGG